MDPAEAFLVFDSCIHVRVRHESCLLESRAVTGVLRGAANIWARENGYEVVRGGVSGWTLGTVHSETRAIYSIAKL